MINDDNNIIDLSKEYSEWLEDLGFIYLDDEDLKTLLIECLDERVSYIWDRISNKCADHDMYLIDFDSHYLHNDLDIEVKLSNKLSVMVSVNIYFEIYYNVNDPRYDDSGCYHNYKPYSVLINNFSIHKEKEVV